jgi:hypothetical protein
MKVRKTIALASMTALLITGAGIFPRSNAYAQYAETVKPNTPEALQAIQKLENEESTDADQSMKLTGRNDALSDNYAEKAEKADELVRWMELGKPVSQQDIDQTLKENR